MLTWLANAWSLGCKFTKFGAAALALTLLGAASALADDDAPKSRSLCRRCRKCDLG